VALGHEDDGALGGVEVFHLLVFLQPAVEAEGLDGAGDGEENEERGEKAAEPEVDAAEGAWVHGAGRVVGLAWVEQGVGGFCFWKLARPWVVSG